MNFVLRVIDRKTGLPSQMSLRAANERAAVMEAGARGYVVESIAEAGTTVVPLDYARPAPSQANLNDQPIDEGPKKQEYRVEFFSPSIDPPRKDGRNPAEQLQTLINERFDEGWIFQRLETVDVVFTLDEGLIARTPEFRRWIKHYLAVFRRSQSA